MPPLPRPRCGTIDLIRQHRRQAPAAMSTVGTQAAVNGRSAARRRRGRSPGWRRRRSHARPKPCRSRAVRIEHGQPDQVGQVDIRPRPPAAGRERSMNSFVLVSFSAVVAVGHLDRHAVDNVATPRRRPRPSSAGQTPPLRVGQRPVRGQIGRVGGVAGDMHQSTHAMRAADYAQLDAASPARFSSGGSRRGGLGTLLRLFLRRGLDAAAHSRPASAPARPCRGTSRPARSRPRRGSSQWVETLGLQAHAVLMLGRQHRVVAADTSR